MFERALRINAGGMNVTHSECSKEHSTFLSIESREKQVHQLRISALAAYVGKFFGVTVPLESDFLMLHCLRQWLEAIMKR